MAKTQKPGQDAGAVAAAPATPAPAPAPETSGEASSDSDKDTVTLTRKQLREAAGKAIEQWFRDHLFGTALSRATPAFNVVRGATEKLINIILKEVF